LTDGAEQPGGRVTHLLGGHAEDREGAPGRVEVAGDVHAARGDGLLRRELARADGEEGLQELRIDLRGALSITVSGKVRQQGTRLLAEISGLPDTPLTRFELTLAGGSRGLLQASRDLCSTPTLPVDAQFAAFSGAAVKKTVSPAIPACAPSATVKLSSLRRGRPNLDLRVVGGRTAVRTTQLTLPSGLMFASQSRVRRLLRVNARGLRRGSRATVTVRGRTMRVTVPRGQSATILRVRMRTGGLRVSQRLRRQGRPRLTFRLQSSLGDGRRPSLRVTARPAG
jgi:hypothetical protein